jgi:hypothetical protein
MDTLEKYGEIPGWYLRWARVSLNTETDQWWWFPPEIHKTIRLTLFLLWELSTSNHNNA